MHCCVEYWLGTSKVTISTAFPSVLSLHFRREFQASNSVSEAVDVFESDNHVASEVRSRQRSLPTVGVLKMIAGRRGNEAATS